MKINRTKHRRSSPDRLKNARAMGRTKTKESVTRQAEAQQKG